MRTVDKKAAELHFNGQRYWMQVMRVMLDDHFHLKSEFVKDVVADAAQQAFRKQFPGLKHVEVEIRLCASNDENTCTEHEANIWWARRRQYEQHFFSVSY